MTTLEQPNYAKYAKYYDAFELAGYSESTELNTFLHDLFQVNNIRDVLDFSCGTGAQAIGLAKHGYNVVACDLNQKMINIARKKGKGVTGLSFKTGNMCTEQYGVFDACISIFNSIGHLNSEEFVAFLINAQKNLKDNGLLIFDIFNYDAMRTSLFEEYRHMSKEAWLDDSLVTHTRNCTLNKSKKQIDVVSFISVQNGVSAPKQWRESWQLQIYTQKEIESYLSKLGYSDFQFLGQNGTVFDKKNSDVLLVIAQK